MRYAALTLRWSFPRAREGGALASGFHPAAPAPSDRVGRGTTRSKPLAEGGCGVCALWHFRLGVGARRKARGQFLVAGAGRTSAAVTSIDRVR